MAVRVVVVVGKMVVVADIGTYLVSISVTLVCIMLLFRLCHSCGAIFEIVDLSGVFDEMLICSLLALVCGSVGADGIGSLSCCF